MYQLYLFLFAVLTIAAILTHRYWVFIRENQKAFKEKVASQVEENRKEQEGENKTFFKAAFLRNQSKGNFDIKRYNHEMAQAELALAKKDWPMAKKRLIQAIAVTKDDSKASLKLAYVYIQTQEYKQAETLYRRLIESDPKNTTAYQQLGWILAKRKQYKESVEAYVRAVELDQKNIEGLIALGKLYHLLMRFSVAGECFRRAAELKPRDVDILFLLAEACEKDDDLENALLAYERILTLEPYNERAKNAIAEVKVKMGQEMSNE